MFKFLKSLYRPERPSLAESIQAKISDIEHSRINYKLQQIAYESEVECANKSLSMLKTELILLRPQPKL